MTTKRFHVEVLLATATNYLAMTSFILPSIIPHTDINCYHMLVDPTNGFNHVLQATFEPYSATNHWPLALKGINDFNDVLEHEPDKYWGILSGPDFDAILVQDGKFQLPAPTCSNNNLAGSQPLTTSIMDEVTPLLNRTPFGPSSNTSSGTSQKASYLSNEDALDAQALMHNDRAMISCSMDPSKNTSLTSSCPADQKEHLAQTEQLLHIDPALIRLDYNHKARPSQTPSPEDGAFFMHLLNQNIEPEQDCQNMPTSVQNTPSWTDLPIDDAEKLAFDLGLECFKPLDPLLPLAEICLDVADEQITKLLIDDEQPDPVYEEAQGDQADLERADKVEWRMPVPPRNDLPSCGEMLDVGDSSTTYSSTVPSSPISTDITSPSNDGLGADGLEDATFLSLAADKEMMQYEQSQGRSQSEEISSATDIDEGEAPVAEESFHRQTEAKIKHDENGPSFDSMTEIHNQFQNLFGDELAHWEDDEDEPGDSMTNNLPQNPSVIAQPELEVKEAELECGTMAGIYLRFQKLFGDGLSCWVDEDEEESIATSGLPENSSITAQAEFEIGETTPDKEKLEGSVTMEADGDASFGLAHYGNARCVAESEHVVIEATTKDEAVQEDDLVKDSATARPSPVACIPGLICTGTLEEGMRIDDTQIASSQLTGSTLNTPPNFRLPSIHGHLIAIFASEFIRIWQQGSANGCCWVPGQDEAHVQSLTQAYMASNYANVPCNLIAIVNDVNSKYGELLQLFPPPNEHDQTHMMRLTALAHFSVQWQYMGEGLKKLEWKRPLLEGDEAKARVLPPEALPQDQTELMPHHINSNGDYVYACSATSPAVSFWAINPTCSKTFFPNLKHQHIVHRKRVLAAQAFKHVDPIQHAGGDFLTPVKESDGLTYYLEGTELQEAVTGAVYKIHAPFGTWQDHGCDMDDNAPKVAQEYDAYPHAGMDIYRYLQRPCYINDSDNEHRLPSIPHVPSEKPGLLSLKAPTLTMHSPLRNEAYNGSAFDLPITIQHKASAHPIPNRGEP